MGILKPLFYPGLNRVPSYAKYGITPGMTGSENYIEDVNIVVVQEKDRRPGKLLHDGDDKMLSDILNRILRTDLFGIRAEFINFYIATVTETDIGMVQIPFQVDVQDYVEQGNPYIESPAEGPAKGFGEMLRQFIGPRKEEEVSFFVENVYAGCARFLVDFSKKKQVPLGTCLNLLSGIGYQVQSAPDHAMHRNA